MPKEGGNLPLRLEQWRNQNKSAESIVDTTQTTKRTTKALNKKTKKKKLSALSSSMHLKSCQSTRLKPHNDTKHIEKIIDKKIE